MNSTWAHFVSWIVQGARLLQRAANGLVRATARLAGSIWAGQVALFLAAARWVAAQVEAVAALLVRIAQGAAFPLIAWNWSDAWNAVAVARLRDRQRIDPSTSSVRDSWQGPAARCYYDVAVEQAAAVDGALAGAELVRDHLRQAALGTGALYAALCTGTFEFLGILCAATGLALSGVGTPEGIALAIGGLADFAALVVTVVTAISLFGYETARVPDALADCFPGGWPSPRPAGFADGSLSDGDTTDWRLRR
jgi:hypothetical protein